MEALRTPLRICIVLVIALCVFSGANGISKRAEECKLGYYGLECKKRIECVFDNKGARYVGTQNTTASGFKCRGWSSPPPANHPSFKSLEENYCRNPNNAQQPWCYSTNPKKPWEYCGVRYCDGCKLGYFGQGCKKRIECVFDNKGARYVGTKHTTASGKECQDWSSPPPVNRPSFKGLEENYCRNPNNAQQPWCYTADPKKPWEYCGVRYCGGVTLGCFGQGCKKRIECVSDSKGARYMGTKHTTASGFECRGWSSPPPANLPSFKGLEENYCRNPNDAQHPWCYTTNPKKIWEYCGVPNCE